MIELSMIELSKGETEIGNGGLHIVKITHEFISGENVGERIASMC